MPTDLALRISGSLGVRAADTRPSTWREDDLSIEAVAATETPTRMSVLEYDREYGGNRYKPFDEILDVAGLSEDEIRGFVGCPILDNHSRWSTQTIVGVIDEARREGTELIVRFRLSKTEDDIVSKVRDGIIRKVSVGYRRKETGAVITEREGQVPLRRSPFIPYELSLVAIGADPNAVTRSAKNLAVLANPSETKTQEPTMNVDAIRSAAAGLATAVAALQTAITNEAPAAPTAERAADPVVPASQTAPEATRSAPQAPQAPAAPVQPAAPVVGQRSAEDQAAIMGLRSIAQGCGQVALAQFDAFEKSGDTVDGLRSLAKKFVMTSDVEINGTRTSDDGAEGQRSFVDFDAAIAAQSAKR